MFKIFWFSYCILRNTLYYCISNQAQKNEKAMKTTGSQIKMKAQELGMNVKTVIPGVFSEIEYLAVTLQFGKTAFFLMDNTTFDYTYSHTYNAVNDKTTKSKPKGF